MLGGLVHPNTGKFYQRTKSAAKQNSFRFFPRKERMDAITKLGNRKSSGLSNNLALALHNGRTEINAVLTYFEDT